MSEEGGFVCVYRRVLENPVFRDRTEAMVFVWMVMQASWRPSRVRYKGVSVDLERGQLALSIRDLGGAFGRSKDWANRFLQRLADRDMTATASATGVNIITICNYDKYQSQSSEAATPFAQHPRQHRDSTATQNKEENKGKKEIGSVSKDTSLRDVFPKPDWADPIVWRDWLAVRKTKKARNTATAYEGFLSDIARYACAEWPPDRILRHAVQKSWAGIYDPKGNRNGSYQSNSDESSTVRAVRAWLAE